jgi:hypothetical protein
MEEGRRFYVVAINKTTGKKYLATHTGYSTQEAAQNACDTLNPLFPDYTHKIFVEV